MKNIMKRIALGIFGVLQGVFGSWWLFGGIAGAFPGTEPGTKDYDEDMWFVPFGVGMILIWLAVMTVTVILNRKDWKSLLAFLLPWGAGTAGLIVFATVFR